ncbi:hypothetical protein DXX93_01080 [Thalassotalea euphylliae]|uniref:Uncharacterized protein n=1 Tax=Thalassotalea euphylliae TaxID=1655234 RepID=A0A3E0TLS2_9GAMM|nr:hypothetical protein [Thalassotalea euphylliae]REL25287.1 hypothetical protein DXX93_01080 [Thalassotalea euphylliae]
MDSKRIRYFCFFVVIFVHITVLNLFYVNEKGITFFWQQAIELNTIVTHLLAAGLSLLVYACAEQVVAYHRKGQVAIRQPVLILCSISMALSIGFLLMN